MRVSQLPIGSFYLFEMLFSVCFLSLACDLSTLNCFCFGCFRFGPTHPPLFSRFILLLFHLFSGGRDAYVNRERGFKCHNLGHWARECTANWDSPRTQAAQAQNTRSYMFFFFYLYANVQRNVTWGIYYCLTIELDHAKSDSRLTAYGGVVLQRLEGLNL